MKIFLVVRGYPSEKDPQWGTFERDQAIALKQLGHEVVVISVDGRFKIKNKYGFAFRKADDIHIYNLFIGPYGLSRFLSYKLYDKIGEKLMFFLFKKVISLEGKPDVIYAHYLNNIISALAIKKTFKTPIVGIEHWSEFGKQNPAKSAINRAKKAYPKLDKLLSVSNFLKRNINKNINIESIILPNMLNKSFYFHKNRNSNKPFRFVTAGNLIPIKNINLILKAFKEISNEFDIHLDIAGDGILKKKLEKYCIDNNLYNVTFHGRLNTSALSDLFNQCDSYIISSNSETFGVSALEAMACGLPVIATDCGGPSEFINESNGILIPVNNVDKMKDAIIEMIKNIDKYDRQNISKEVIEKFSSEKIGKQLNEIFQKTLEEFKKK